MRTPDEPESEPETLAEAEAEPELIAEPESEPANLEEPQAETERPGLETERPGPETGAKGAGKPRHQAPEETDTAQESGPDCQEDRKDAVPGLDVAAEAEQDRGNEPEKPVLPRRPANQRSLPPAAVTANATPAAWLDLLGQPYLNDEAVLERVLGSLKRL
ncbi:hypothetical protein L083_6315 [Actinoplanes sp. N902-109]|nr:hypothetical protein L083_6315 [Actinoplanes sp. N902-109]